MARPIWLGLAISCIGLGGCIEDPTTGEATLAVQGGARTRLFTGVGFLENADTQGACGATLIGERTLLTAAHCLLRDAHGVELDLVPASRINFYPHEDASELVGARFAAERLIPHPEFGGGGKHDIAVVILKAAPPASATRYPLATRTATVGEQVAIVGYGAPRDQRRQVATNTIAVVRTTTYEIQGTGNICDGDSGASSIVTRGDEQLVLGVHTGRIGACGRRGIDMRVDAYAGWILEQAGDDVLVGADAGDEEEPDGDEPADAPGVVDGAGDEAAGCAAAGGQGAGGLGVLLAALAGVRRRRTQADRN